MCSFHELKAGWRKALAGVWLAAVASAGAQAPGPDAGIGRAATPQEIAAWDIDVRPDFQGLPPGSGSVARGQALWEAQCASCHGVFGESNEVFSPLVGGTTPQDIATGRVANLKRTDYPGRTTLMKLPHLSTLWDYIRRAMPWNQPKSLSPDDVYALTAFMLNLGGIVPDGFTLSQDNIADVQQRLPNRNGMNTDHALWPGAEFGPRRRPDVQSRACMKDCGPAPSVASRLPDFARDAHGNLAQQNRTVGAQRGADTGRPSAGGAKPGGPAPAPAAATAPSTAAAGTMERSGAASVVLASLQKNSCTGCHAPATKLVGPSWADIGKKHAGKPEYLADKIRSGSAGVWGPVPMPPQPLEAGEARRIADWLAAGATP